MGLQRSEIKVEINKGSSKRVKNRKPWRKDNSDRPWKSGGKETEFMIEAH